jgi:hypothetical protein
MELLQYQELYLRSKHVIDTVINSSERQNGTFLISFRCVIENNVHEHLLE